ncbi:MAG: hypothetical protein GKR89_18540 [Candidatus Latescibacteria bacterium]|nr:hypothetical protein [Candidatus Latescibacterota bacterium]
MSANPKRVRLLPDCGGGRRRAWPVTQGVPFADGQLVRGAPVRLVDKVGVPQPVQAHCLTTWGPDAKYVKWLLVDFQIDLGAGVGAERWLEYGPGVDAGPPPGEPVEVAWEGDALRLDTGPLQVELRRDRADLFAACRIRCHDGWRDILPAGPGPRLYMRDQDGVEYHSAVAAPQVEIEEQGALRTAIRIAGRHAADGRLFCPYILRLHFYAGRPEIRCFHTFVFDQDPEQVELSRIGFSMPVDVGGGQRLIFAGATGVYRMGGGGRLLQLSDEEYRVEADGAAVAQGRRTAGWASLGGRRAAVGVVVRDMWREYPKGIAVENGALDVQIWPACGRTLSFSTPFKEEAIRFAGTRDEAEFRRLVEARPTAPLNLKSLNATSPEELRWVEEMVARYAPGRPASYNDTGVDNGRGAAKTSEFLLCFGETLVDGDMAALAEGVQEPVLAPAGPDYACATGALRLAAPQDRAVFPEVEAGLDGLFERVVVEPRAKMRTYGMIDYGDLICSHSASPAALWELVKEDADVVEKMKYCARSYNNESNDQLNALWGFFTHSGRRAYFLAAEAYGRHMADIDIIHAPAGDRAGLVHYHNAHHWSGGPSPSHTCIAGLMLQYYLTGNRRLLEVCREVADWGLAQAEPCGVLGNRDGALVREFTTPVANLLEFYQATWEEPYFALARRSLKWLFLAMPQPGCFPFSIYTGGPDGDEAEVEQSGWHLRQAGGMTPQLLWDAVQLLGAQEPLYTRALVAMARRYVFFRNDIFETIRLGPDGVEQLDPYFNAPIIAYAYWLTREPVFAAYCRYYLREHFPVQAEKMSFTYVCWGSIVPPLLAAARQGVADHGAAGLDGAEAKWLAQVGQRDSQGDASATERPPRRSLGVIEGYE